TYRATALRASGLTPAAATSDRSRVVGETKAGSDSPTSPPGEGERRATYASDMWMGRPRSRIQSNASPAVAYERSAFDHSRRRTSEKTGNPRSAQWESISATSSGARYGEPPTRYPQETRLERR